MPIVEFEGVTHEFPDDFNDADIAVALQESTSTPQGTTAMADGIEQPEMAQSEADEAQVLVFPLEEKAPLPKETVLQSRDAVTPVPFGDIRATLDITTPMKKDVTTFRDKIAQVETGGLDNPFIRTKVDGSGSSAYGTFQITKGLLVNNLKNRDKLFTTEEKQAMAELIVRQSIALKIGGSDRKTYAKGGREHALAQVWSDRFGYETVEDFLDAFDYGGDYGLADNTAWKLQYENFSRKMLKDTLKQAKGNQIEAASIWHGGSNWRKAKSRKGTDRYRDKFSKLELA